MENEETKVEVLAPTAVAHSELGIILKAEIDTQISTAKAYPRSLKQFFDKALSMATISESVAASCNYAVPRGGKTLSGPSVRLAEIVTACYGNIRSGARVIANDGKTITAQGICHDLETNNCVTVEVKRKITDRNGKTFNEDMQTVTGNAACAIAFRNAVFKVIPAALVQDVYEQTKSVARGTAETLPQRRDKAITFLSEKGIKQGQICSALGVKRVEDIDLDKLVDLRGIVSAIQNGETTIEHAFYAKEEINPDDLQMLFETKKELMKADDVIAVERILKSKEVASYAKVKRLLEEVI